MVITTILAAIPTKPTMVLHQRDFAADEGDAPWYESILVRRPAANVSSSSPAIQTSPAAASAPPTSSLTIDAASSADSCTDTISEHSDGWSDIAADTPAEPGTPLALPSGTMAEEFSEGRLETFVGSPQKELAGTQNAYVSYLVTTKVGLDPATLHITPCSQRMLTRPLV